MKIRHIVIVASVPIFLILLLITGYKYKTEYAKTEIEIYHSDDYSYQLAIYNIGEPAWPFGPGKCRFILTREDKKINELDITIFNDGKWPQADNFDLSWKQDCVLVLVNGEEQEDITYTLFFDGTSTSEQ